MGLKKHSFTDDKRTLVISGQLLFPLSVGNTAFIREESGLRQTSTVVRIGRISRNTVKFDTRNTHYRLHLREGDIS